MLSETGGVSRMAAAVVPPLQTKVPVTAVTGPGVPLELLPFRTSPSTSKNVSPFERFTLAWPLRTDQGPAPAWTPPTGLSTPGAVITPTMPFQRTTESSLSDASAEDAHIKVSTTANIFFIFVLSSKQRYQFWLLSAYRLTRAAYKERRMQT